jgi:hypothetical protein
MAAFTAVVFAFFSLLPPHQPDQYRTRLSGSRLNRWPGTFLWEKSDCCLTLTFYWEYIPI